MNEQKYDVVIIGAGPAGYPAAIRAAQNGLSVACIDDWQNRDGSHSYGGTCLNAGCIPSKALLESSELYHRSRSEFKEHGIVLGDVVLDLKAMQARKGGIVRRLTRGIDGLLKSNGVVVMRGHGCLVAGDKVEVTGAAGDCQTVRAGNVVLATGSIPIALPAAPFDHKRVVDSWGGLEFEAVPKRLGVIGCGVVGLELGSIWQRLGSEVVILEALGDFLPMVDHEVAEEARGHFKRQGLDIRLGAEVTGASVSANGVTLSYNRDSESHSMEVDRLIVCVGRRPFTDSLLGENTGVEFDDNGFIKVDDSCRTTVPTVWAIGDVVRGPMLAHKGTEEGVMVADLIAGKFNELSYKTIPSVIYTSPEMSWVGQTETEVKASGRAYKVGTFPFLANGRAQGMQQTEGLVKLIAAESDDAILGVHIVGPLAGELIGEAVLAMGFSASAEDLQRTMHAHPTLTEALHEAALSADGSAIHVVNG
ncbi:MAG: dihydrolipoyl dehydrogenase [Gammaproteobacteria bacterium]